MTKTLQTREEAFIQFTDEEMEELNINKGDKFTIEDQGDGSIKLVPFATLELDLSVFTREYLEQLIIQSDKNDQTISEYIADILQEVVDNFE